MQQIDRFSRDTIIAFTHALDKDAKGNTLYSLILKIKDKEKREKMELKFEKLRENAQTIIFHRNKVIAHHNTGYNSKLGEWYPTQPFNYAYILNPCFCDRVRLKTAKLFWDLKYILAIDGVGSLHVSGGKIEDVFNAEALGAREGEKSGLNISHKCRYKDCLLK